MNRPGTVSPSPRLPGYIPGMPRPMTPRDKSFDSDDQLSRANSITPRAAASPAVIVPLRLSPGGSRNESNPTSAARPRPTSPGSSTPLFLPRSVNGRFTPTDDHQRNGSGSFSTEFDSSMTSSLLGTRRRPASPLSPLLYQPMAVSSRPGTPSNVTWNPQPSSPTKSQEGHSRNGSWTSASQDMHDAFGSLEGAGVTTRSLRSPALPDSPTIFDMSQGDSNGQIDNRPSSALSRGDLSSPVSLQNRVVRSPTPTQNAPRSPASPTFTNYDVTSSGMNGSRRSSNQTYPSSPFSLGTTQPLVFSPMANSSRSSLESDGSSYHSWDAGLEKDRGIELLINDIDPQQTAWHNVGGTDKSSEDDEFDEEEIIGRSAGLTKSDFVAIQEKLVGAAIAKSTPPPRDRVPSLRRRRPSTSQSNYSLNGFDSRVSCLLYVLSYPLTLLAGIKPSSPNTDSSLSRSPFPSF
jgi:serine/arginine repetitive matrix protein 2